MATGSIIYRFIKQVNEFTRKKQNRKRKRKQSKREIETKPILFHFYLEMNNISENFVSFLERRESIENKGNKLIFITTIYYCRLLHI